MACQAIPDKDLVSAATTIFRGDGGSFVGLKSTFESNNGFWRTGHTFDSIIDYFIEIEPADAAGFGQAALAASARSMTNACWYDDYGWWGLAAQRASWHPKLFGDDAKALGELAYKPGDPMCFWSVFHDHAPNVWKNNAGNSGLAVFQPRFAGGVWNCDWTQPDACGIVNGSPPLPQNCSDNRQGIKANLIGVQNTVTNALYFILAERLHGDHPAIPDFRVAALAELKFLNSWLFTVEEADLSLLSRFGQSSGPAVVRERVGSYAYDQNTRSYPHVCGYDAEIAWSGDQGLMLEAMVDRMNVIGPNSQPEYGSCFQLAQDIIAGVQSQATAHHGGLLTPWVTDAAGTGDEGDYDTGPAAYMRGLRYAFRVNSDMRAYIAGNCVPFVCKNAEDVLNNYASHSGDMTQLTNDLATLVAARVIAGT